MLGVWIPACGWNDGISKGNPHPFSLLRASSAPLFFGERRGNCSWEIGAYIEHLVSVAYVFQINLQVQGGVVGP